MLFGADLFHALNLKGTVISGHLLGSFEGHFFSFKARFWELACKKFEDFGALNGVDEVDVALLCLEAAEAHFHAFEDGGIEELSC